MRFIHLCLLTAALGLCGCTGYRLGPTRGPVAGAQSVQITPFLNHSSEPGLADELTGALRKSIQRDGSLRLATHDDGDLIVEGTITSFRRRELSLLTEDIRTVRDYQIAMVVHVTARERASGKVVIDREFTGGTLLRVGSDLSSSERQAAPLVAQDLARQITSLLVDGSW
jgi:hypothetical protein